MKATVLLLSGGASKRMGQDKASLSIGDQDLLSWQEQRFRQAGFNVVSRVSDVFTGFRGPLAGLHAACFHYRHIEAWLVVPVDMPSLSVTTLTALAQAGENRQTAVSFEHCPLPLYVPNTPELESTLATWLQDANGRRSVYALMDALQGEWLDKQNYSAELTNLNTPEQWQQFITGAQTV